MPVSSPRKRGPIFQRRWLWVPGISAFTRVFRRAMRGNDRERKTAALFLLALVAHAGAVDLDLVVRPGMLRQLSGLGVAVAQRILPRAAHLILAALREARRCQGGNREPQRQRRSPVHVPTDHHRSPSNAPHEPKQRTQAEIVGCNGAAALQACRPQRAGTFTKSSSPVRDAWNAVWRRLKRVEAEVLVSWLAPRTRCVPSPRPCG